MPLTNGQINLGITDANQLFIRARAVKEKAFALQAQAEADQVLGSLVKKEDVERSVFTAARQLRDQLINLSKRIAPELFEQKSVAKLEKKLSAEIRNVLLSVSKRLMKETDERST